MSNATSERKKLFIVCPDGTLIDADPLYTESLSIQVAYRFENVVKLKTKSNSDTINKVVDFCKGRAKLKNDFADDPETLKHKLNNFNSQFRQQNQSRFAIDLYIAAFNLEIGSLVDGMWEAVDSAFKDMNADEAYEILPVNLKKFDNDRYTHSLMLDHLLHDCEWAFQAIK
ncbi:uncharacterized protein [Rutidosis leptorrhynchoides]|uniref:uncharacterized protein n=1 Tax=Rutidosis leptorrhynchoides TaxID=125765 RepID=UPI003A98FD38